jgi:tetraacyldisaccharide 4'-kinase
LSALSGAAVFVISAIGDARAFHEQLVERGARLVPPPAAFPDHHPFDGGEVARLAREGSRAELVVCTLKDAVKLAPLWPRAGPPLWYVSQRVTPEGDADAVEKVLRTVLDARAPRDRAAHLDSPGSGRLTATDHGHRPPPADR